jgi:NRAMP (natural resistance-associated macrophage protein)-like metal ion transporter
MAGKSERGEALKFGEILGPGLITGASDDDPSGIATYSQAGAVFGYALGWTLVLTYPLMVAVQMISARVGRTTGAGIAANLRRYMPHWLLLAIVLPLLIANTANLGADLGAMADAAGLVTGWSPRLFLPVFALFCAVTQVLVTYSAYARVLKWLTLALLAYVITLFLVAIDWHAMFAGIAVPTVALNSDGLMMVVAIFGTTISPYLFFWQASLEAQEIVRRPKRKALNRAPKQGRAALLRIELDTLVGMAASNFVGLAIMITAAATLHRGGHIDIESSAQAAEALRPIAGEFAFALFALGIIGTGLLAVPVFAGSAAYAIGEALEWPTGLERKPMHAKAFYATIMVATGIGMALNFLPVNPMRALVWTAVLNGVVAVPVMGIMMLLSRRRDVMGRFVVKGPLAWLGWLTTALMAAAVIAMAVAAGRG